MLNTGNIKKNLGQNHCLTENSLQLNPSSKLAACVFKLSGGKKKSEFCFVLTYLPKLYR